MAHMKRSSPFHRECPGQLSLLDFLADLERGPMIVITDIDKYFAAVERGAPAQMAPPDEEES